MYKVSQNNDNKVKYGYTKKFLKYSYKLFILCYRPPLNIYRIPIKGQAPLLQLNILSNLWTAVTADRWMGFWVNNTDAFTTCLQIITCNTLESFVKRYRLFIITPGLECAPLLSEGGGGGGGGVTWRADVGFHWRVSKHSHQTISTLTAASDLLKQLSLSDVSCAIRYDGKAKGLLDERYSDVDPKMGFLSHLSSYFPS